MTEMKRKRGPGNPEEQRRNREAASQRQKRSGRSERQRTSNTGWKTNPQVGQPDYKEQSKQI